MQLSKNSSGWYLKLSKNGLDQQFLLLLDLKYHTELENSVEIKYNLVQCSIRCYGEGGLGL